MKMRRLAMIVLAALAASPSVEAAPGQRADELKAIEQKLKEKQAEESRLKNEAQEREQEVAALRYRLVETANSLQGAEKRMADITAELARLSAEEDRLKASLKTQQANLSDVLAALQSLELAKPPALLVSPDDANKAARAAMLLGDAAPQLQKRADALKADLDRLAELKKARDKERAAFQKTNEEIQSRRAVLAELLQKKQAERDVAASLAAAAQKETAALAARATSLRDVIDRLERLARVITPRIKPPPPRPDQPVVASSETPSPDRRAEAFRPARPFIEARGSLKPPVVGRVINVYGAPRPEGGRYEGLRFAVADQSIVTSPYQGNVVFARAWGAVGNLIVLDVGGGYHILLLGVSAFLVHEGQQVAAGEPLGLMESPEPGQEASLNFEIRKNGEPVNPALWLAGNNGKETGF